MRGRSLTEIVDSEACCEHGHDHGNAKVNLLVAVIGGILIINSWLAQYVVYAEDTFASTFSAVVGALILAAPILISAVKDVLRGRVYMNELVALALLAAFVMQYYQEAGIIAFFMLLAITIEERTAIGAKTSIEELIRLTPSNARRVNVETNSEDEVAAAELLVDDVIRVRPGENFPVDGVVVTGSSEVNEATITGESLPAIKEIDSRVFAGTENLTGSVDVRVTGIGEDTTIGNVRELIAKAERTRLPIMRLVDRYVVYYTPTILMIAAMVWFFHPDDLMRVVLVLVIACPCALIVATPSAAVAAIASAARLGMLIKNVAHIEVAAHINAVVFDKTGTLTEGNLEIARLNPAEGVEPADLLHVAVSAESRSNHPAAKAMRRLAEEASVTWQEADSFTEVPGKGVFAKVEGCDYRVGRESWLVECDLPVDDALKVTEDTADSSGLTVIYVAKGQQVLGWIGLRDKVRNAAAAAVDELGRLGIRHCCMVTGDNDRVARAVAATVGITNVRAECLPEHKVEFVEEFKSQGAVVAVIGDGVNDAPALAAGSIGIAMGAIGSDVAVNSASIALMNNDLRRIPFLISLSRKTRTVMNQNLAFGALLIIGGLMAFIFGNDLLDKVAATAKLDPSVFKAFTAAIVHILGTLFVVFNSARLVRFGEALEASD